MHGVVLRDGGQCGGAGSIVLRDGGQCGGAGSKDDERADEEEEDSDGGDQELLRRMEEIAERGRGGSRKTKTTKTEEQTPHFIFQSIYDPDIHLRIDVHLQIDAG